MNAVPKSVQQSRKNRSCARHGFRAGIMCTLYFPNGNVQTFSSSNELFNAVYAFGGDYNQIGGNAYAFIPKK